MKRISKTELERRKKLRDIFARNDFNSQHVDFRFVKVEDMSLQPTTIKILIDKKFHSVCSLRGKTRDGIYKRGFSDQVVLEISTALDELGVTFFGEEVVSQADFLQADFPGFED